MENFAGKYAIIKSENYAEYVAALELAKQKNPAAVGVPASVGAPAPVGKAVPVVSTKKPTIEFVVDGNKFTTIKSNSSDRPTLILNEEVDETSPDGLTAKTLLKLDGSNLVVEMKFPEGTVAKRTYTLSGPNLTVKMSSTKPGVPEATITFKKL